MARESVVSDKMKFLISLIALQFCYAGFHFVSRLALNMSVSKVVYPVYRNIIALLLLGPCAYFLEKITANQGFYLLGLYYASPTFASAMQNSVPAITFVMASALRLEKVNISRRDGWAKVVGTIVSVGGATIITLYKGPPLLLHHLRIQQPSMGNSLEAGIAYVSLDKVQNWTLGCVYLLGHCLSWAGWLVFQAPVLKKVSSETLTHFIYMLFWIDTVLGNRSLCRNRCGALENPIDGGALDHPLCCNFLKGIVASGIGFSLQTWCIHKGGPVSVAVFQPVQTVLVAFMASLILGDQLYSGGIIGAILIMVGLYSVLWGESEEKRVECQEKEETLTKPLLLDVETGKVESPVVSSERQWKPIC
ncbi:hypothetical protein GIB67_022437 [Kingdonia uniflora]|uniref:WAT1-related protein n=1 Tax=Kingdonia uniflora TaxID=39325 RepID=A0A7J7MU62_9MAGN|nr:hypothetical protein GIB67_022437 [Kingdonia uniflora]